MAGTAYAINVVFTDGVSGYLKFNGDGTWGWHVVYDVNEATLYRSKSECIDDFYKHVKNSTPDDPNVTYRVDTDRCTIAECYCPWL